MMKSQDQLKKMLTEKRISVSDYQLLSAALKKKAYLTPLWINPFQKIAGFPALILGWGIMLLLSYLGTIGGAYFIGIMNAGVKENYPNFNHAPSFFLLFSELIISWLVICLLFMTAALVLGKKSGRLIDFLGTTALAVFPLLLITNFYAITRTFFPLFYAVDFIDVHIVERLLAEFMFFLMFASYAWQVGTYFQAYKITSGLTGAKLWTSYIVCMIIATSLTIRLTFYLA